MSCLKYWLTAIGGLLLLSAYPQNMVGLPHVSNYSKLIYKGGLQNWDFAQDANGILYVANNEGMLVFDGSYWKIYPLPNKTITRSLGLDKGAGKIFVGGQDELGYFQPLKNGVLGYYTLTHLIPQKYRSFGDVWDIVTSGNRIFFRTEDYIFEYHHNQLITHIAPSEWGFLGVCNGRVLAQDFQEGLLSYQNGQWLPFCALNTIAKNDPVTGMVPLSVNSFLVTTLKNGILKYSDTEGLVPLKKEQNTDRIYCASYIMENQYAIGTINSGIRIVDSTGRSLQVFSKKSGLQNENILSVFIDQQKNIWAGLDNGIDMVHYNSPIRQINPLDQDGAGYTALIENQILYLGTSTGVYATPLVQQENIGFNIADFRFLKNAEGQVWQLASVQNQVLMGHHEGFFSITGNHVKNVIAKPGFWNFTSFQHNSLRDTIVAGNYKGIQLLQLSNGVFHPLFTIPGFEESSRYLVIDPRRNIWVSHPYHGIFQITSTRDGYRIKTYTSNGLPGRLNNHVFNIKDQLLVATEKGIYFFDYDQQQFKPHSYYNHMLNNRSIRYLKEDAQGNIWYISEKNVGVIDLSLKNKPACYDITELNSKLLSGFEFIYPVNGSHMILGGERGFYLLDYPKYKQQSGQPKVNIREVSIFSNRDSILFGGYYGSLQNTATQPAEQVHHISNEWRNLHFEFSSNAIGSDQNNFYAVRLKGYDETWSDYTAKTEKDYTNLPEGWYTFEVKVKNKLGQESPVAGYRFVVRPPWYRSLIAHIVYILFTLTTALLIYRWVKQKLIKQREKFEEEQRRLRYIHDLELAKNESEIITLKNEKLESEIHFKNAELASSAMHIVKKGELIGKMKTELTQIMSLPELSKTNLAIKKLIKALHSDEHIDEEWDNFSKHFDKVHSDFTVTLKKLHPNLTGNEVKLCAYLRMNLSTKEIAQLSNISTRGAEISRYRLRKKLGIPFETRLFDYLISIS